MTDSPQPAFDAYDTSYEAMVQKSIDFSGLSFDFVAEAKANLIAELIARQLPGCERANLLDVGCGVGALHPMLSARVGSVHGADISSACIERARRDNPHAQYTAYDGERLPFEDGAFDVAVTVCVLHHVPPAQWSAFVGELRRAVRPGGLVAIIEHNPFNPLTRLAVMRCPFDADAVLVRRARAKALLSAAGCRDIGSRHYLFFPWRAGWARAIERRIGWLPMGAQYVAYGRA